MEQPVPDGYFRQLCEHMGVTLISTDRELTIRTWNAAATRMFGAAAERMIGTPIGSIVPQESREIAERMLRRSIHTAHTFQFEFQHRDEAGRNRELVGTIAPVISDSGDHVGASLCIRDITRRINLQQQLADSRKMASLGAVAGAIAHHFNNILGGVITSVDFAMGSENAAVTAKVLKNTSRALQRASGLVRGLLAFAQGEPQAHDLSDFTEIVNDLAEEMEKAVEGRNVEFVLTMPELPVMCVERMRVRTVLHNIAQNALEAMPDGGRLTIDVALGRDKIVIRICDTGIGLDEAAKSRIFEPFWSTKGELTPQSDSAEGTGLGLAIAHGLVQTIGGTIEVSSEPGKGATFIVTLPRPDSQ
ncbi:MAG: PAS domain S-box protein [Planctomycetes bacterium]|nr:PAS domain S-box protein [Planctomycetota bacterium]